MSEPEKKALVFRLNDHGQGPELLRQVFLECGWKEFDEDEQEEHDWNLWWRSSRFRKSDYEQLLPWQRLNHHPKCTAITKKDSLARNMKRMKGVYGSGAYNFSPVAFNLPNDYTKFVAEYSRLKEKDPEKHLYWICKPADLSRGRGIFIFRELSELQYDCNAVVQQYVSNPLLISGYKFDLRIYVLVSSFHPLNVYIYNEGLVRFSTEKYDLSKTGNLFSHLTNTSINKHSPSYTTDKERVGPGCKWTLTQLRSYLRQINIDDNVLFAKILNIVLLTLIVQANQAPKSSNCFEVYGFDIIIDENLKPWLLEVNFSPSLGSDCQVDILVKKPMVHDLLDLLKLSEKDKERGGPNFKPHFRPFGFSIPGRFSSFDSSYRPSPPSNMLRFANHSKLPDIQSTGSHSVVTSGTSQGSCSSRQGDLDTEEEMVPIVPGCGLPSVQQPPPRHYSSCSSGRSSVSSGISCDPSEAESASRTSQKPHKHRHKPSKKTQAKNVLPSTGRIFNPSFSGSGNHPNLNSWKFKNKAKTSVQSDSAISSNSGSSDGSDMPEKTLQTGKLADSSKSQILPAKVASALNRFDSGDPYSTLLSTSCPQISPRRTSSLNSDCPVTDFESISTVTPRKSSKESVSPDARQFTAKRGTKVPSPALAKHRSSSHVSFTANPLTTKSALLNKRLSLGSLVHNSVQRNNAPNSYAKPWRKTKSSIPLSTNAKTINSPPLRVGDYILSFPFNDVTKRCSLGNLDPKIIIQECQKLLKERTQGKERMEKEDLEGRNGPGHVLWGALGEEVVKK